MMEEWRHERENAETALLVHQHMHAHESEEPRGGFEMMIRKRVVTMFIVYQLWRLMS